MWGNSHYCGLNTAEDVWEHKNIAQQFENANGRSGHKGNN